MMKNRGFTLVEMLVVLGILGILVTVILKVSSGGMESARAAKCIANMKTLASACDSYAASKRVYPYAGTLLSADYLNGNDSIAYGWIGTDGNGTSLGCYVKEQETREDSLINGQLFAHVNNNRDVFVCPTHRNAYKQNPPAWSYAMNELFGWNSTGAPVDITMLGIRKDSVPGVANGTYSGLFGKYRQVKPPLERILLFAEIPFTATVEPPPFDASSGSTECDCTLQYIDKDEYIGFNHKFAGGMAAHVVFCDGHVEKLMWHNNMSKSDAETLTKMLGCGADVSFNGSAYVDLYE